MNDKQFDAVCAFIESLWGESRRWEPNRRGPILGEFDYLEERDAIAAVRSLFEQGFDNAPSPSVVKKETLKMRGERRSKEEFKANPTSCRHTWAIWEEEEPTEQKPEPRRLGKCVICDSEKWFQPGKLLTASELAKLEPEARGDEADLERW